MYSLASFPSVVHMIRRPVVHLYRNNCLFAVDERLFHRSIQNDVDDDKLECLNFDVFEDKTVHNNCLLFVLRVAAVVVHSDRNNKWDDYVGMNMERHTDRVPPEIVVDEPHMDPEDNMNDWNALFTLPIIFPTLAHDLSSFQK